MNPQANKKINQQLKSNQSIKKSIEKCYLLLADGNEFEGQLVGLKGYAVGELIFNTAMTGYQEIITDPSYAKQLICFTSSHIGNVGISQFDYESSSIKASGLIMRDYCSDYSNWRSEMSLGDWLIEKGITAISDIDTREITKRIRIKGAMNAVIYSEGFKKKAQGELAKFKGLAHLDLAKVVSTKKIDSFKESVYDLASHSIESNRGQTRLKVAVLDFGIKTQILRILVSLGCELTIFPAQTDFKTINKFAKQNLEKDSFDGVFLSNGPGDPEPCNYAIKTIKEIVSKKIPIFGICLGYQLLALALGAKTQKMHTGHHGANHPVLCLKTNRVLITSQNHSFCVAESLPQNLKITHLSLFDNTIQGIELKSESNYLAYGFQGHPEASPGPHDVRKLFNRFINEMKRVKTNLS